MIRLSIETYQGVSIGLEVYDDVDPVFERTLYDAFEKGGEKEMKIVVDGYQDKRTAVGLTIVLPFVRLSIVG